MNWIELITILGGLYLTLLAYRIIPKKPKDPEKFELWHKKFGKLLKILGPFLILWGILKLCNIF